MVTVKLRYVYQDVDRHGNVRVYFWRKGHRKVRIRETTGTPQFFERYRQLLAQSHAGELNLPQSKTPKAGTFRWLCGLYFGSTVYQQLDKRNQRMIQLMMEKAWDEPIAPNARETFADFPIERMTPKAVRVLRDRKTDFPAAANARVKCVSRIFSWAI